MKAMILAAGMGTRLKPLTNYRPKALVRINDRPLLEICIRRLIRFGFDEMIINVHHFAEQILQFLEEHNNFGARISISDEQDRLLGTGGGLKKAAWFFDDGQPFLLCNTDIISNIDLAKFYQAHQKSSLATLAIRQRESSRYLAFDQQQQLIGWANTKSGQLKLARAGTGDFSLQAFSGLHIIDPKLFALMPNQSAFSIIDVYLKAARTHPILGYTHDQDVWLDAGKQGDIIAAEQLLKEIEMSKEL